MERKQRDKALAWHLPWHDGKQHPPGNPLWEVTQARSKVISCFCCELDQAAGLGSGENTDLFVHMELLGCLT